MHISHPTRLVWFGMLLLFALYLLVYVNQPASIDGDATLAVTQNLVAYQTPTIEVIGASENLLPPMSRMGTTGIDGALYSKKGITPSLALLPLVLLAQVLPDASVRALAMLFNPLVTLGTALMLVAIARRLAVSPMNALIGALLYGGATMALPYTQTLFGEPLAGLLLLVTVYAIMRYNVDMTYTRWLVIAGVALGAMIGINYSYAIMTPFFALFLLYGEGRIQWRRWRILILLLLPVMFIMATLLGYNMVRYGNPFTSGYNFAEGEGFNYPIWWGMFGLWLSPYRGMFWYNPILLWLLIALRGLWREHRAILLLVLGVTLAQSLIYSAWWSWHGGIVWAPRFLVPVLPLLMLLITLSLETTRRTRWQRMALAGLAIVSFAVQLLGTLIPYHAYYGFLYGNYGTFVPEGLVSGLQDEVMINPALSPIVGHFDLLRTWLASPAEAGWQIAYHQAETPTHMLALIVIVLAGLMAIIVRRLRYLAGLALVIGTLAIPLSQHHAPSLVNQINATIEADVLVVAEQRIGNALIDVRGMIPISTNAPTSPDDAFTQTLWQQALALAEGQTLALVMWFMPASPEDWQAQALWRNYAFIDGDFLPDAPVGEDTRPRRYERFRLLTLTPDIPLNATWNGQVHLSQMAIVPDEAGIGLALAWEGQAPTDIDYSFFVHVLDAGGNIIAQQDRQPLGGYAPTTTWGDTPVIDRLYFPLLDASQAQAIRIGWVDWRDGQRLSLVLDGDIGMSDDNTLIIPVGE